MIQTPEIIDQIKLSVMERKYVVIPSTAHSNVYFKNALLAVRKEGYVLAYFRVKNGENVRIVRVLASPGTTFKEIHQNLCHAK